MSEWSRSVLSDSLRPCRLPGSVHGILQARILEWVTISFSKGSSWPRDRTRVSRIGGRCFNLWATREAQCRILIEALRVFRVAKSRTGLSDFTHSLIAKQINKYFKNINPSGQLEKYALSWVSQSLWVTVQTSRVTKSKLWPSVPRGPFGAHDYILTCLWDD